MAIQLVLQVILVVVLIQKASTQESSVALPGCQEKCGDVTIRHPFGIGRNCSVGLSYEIYCNNTFNRPPKPFLLSDNVEVLNISVPNQTISVLNPVFKDCTNETEPQKLLFLDLHFTEFTFSGSENLFIAMGCNNLALVKAGAGDLVDVGGCMSFCDSTTTRNNDCFGINCCQTIIPSYYWNFSTSLRTIDPIPGHDLCKYAFIVDKNWFGNLTDIYSVQKMKQVPAVLFWETFGPATDKYPCTNSSVCGRNTYCESQTCFCRDGYKGFPYMLDGCIDIDECSSDHPPCQQICVNTEGSYNCLCHYGWEAIGKYNCTKKPVNVKETGNVKKALIITAIGAL